MEIDKTLKDNLICDVENILEKTLDTETKIALKRCFEITVGTYDAKFVLFSINECLPPVDFYVICYDKYNKAFIAYLTKYNEWRLRFSDKIIGLKKVKQWRHIL